MLDLKKYETVAMLDLPDDEREAIGNRAAALAGSFSALDIICTDDVEPLVSVLDLSNILREDFAEKLLTRDEILANAPEHGNGYFLVPGTLGV